MAGDASTISSPGVRAVSVRKRGGAEVSDFVAVEAPLEIRVGGRPLVITMRTPGHDDELAVGFLYAEGVVTSGDQIVSIPISAATESLNAGIAASVALYQVATARAAQD